MKIILLSAFAALTLMTVAACAESEGNGDPFPFGVTGVVTATGPTAGAASVASTRVSRPAAQSQETAEALSSRTPRRHP